MTEAAILTVGLQPTSSDSILRAARIAFSEFEVRNFNRLDEILACEPVAAIELLILPASRHTLLGEARSVSDAMGLPRWAVIGLAGDEEFDPLGSLASKELAARFLAQEFRWAATQHRLKRDNARMAGDLRTIAHRISHDLRAPLGVILSTGDVLKEITADGSEAGLPLVKSIADSVDELERHIRRVSLLIKATLNPPRKSRVQMAEIVWTVLQRLDRKIGEADVRVSQPPSWPEIEGVPQFLETVWVNFLANALQHAKGLSRLDLGWEHEPAGIRFWVCDDGCGVPAARLPTLFRPFNLLHGIESSSGLGLSIVQRLVELQGGRCGHQPKAEIETGACFYFTLPRGS